MIQLSNGPSSTTLTAAINNSTTTIPVVSTANLPSTGDFYFRIDNELLKATSLTGTSITALRGQELTTATSHASGAVVQWYLTKATLEGLFGDYFDTGPVANLPTVGREGMTYVTTNGHYLYRHNGTSWIPWGPIQLVKRPLLANFSWVNQGTATANETNGVLTVNCPAVAGGTQELRILKKAMTGTQFTVGVEVFAENFNNWGAGIILRESSSGKLKTWGYYNQTTAPGRGDIIKWTNANTISSSYYLSSNSLWRSAGMARRVFFFRIGESGSNHLFQTSTDNFLYYTFEGTIAKTDFLTADEIGLYALTSSTTKPLVARFFHFEEV